MRKTRRIWEISVHDVWVPLRAPFQWSGSGCATIYQALVNAISW